MAREILRYVDVTSKGNFDGRNILHVSKSLAEVAKQLGLSPQQVQTTVEESRDILYDARRKRSPPLRDEKILTAWNGLMILAQARAALVLGEPQ